MTQVRRARLRLQLRKLSPEALPAGPQLPPPRSPGGSGVAAAANRAASPADQARVRRLEMMGGWICRERLRILWYRLRLTVQEMNYATHRMVGLQTRLP